MSYYSQTVQQEKLKITYFDECQSDVTARVCDMYQELYNKNFGKLENVQIINQQDFVLSLALTDS